MYVTKSAFWQSVKSNLRSNDVMLTMAPSAVTIHPHHFPTSYLKWNIEFSKKRSICTPLSKSDASLITKHDLSHDRFTQYTNSVSKLHGYSFSKQQSTTLDISPKLKKKYVKSPFASINEVKTYVESLSNHKTSQHNKYSLSKSMDKVFATPLPSEVPIESPKRPIRQLLNIPISNLTSVPEYLIRNVLATVPNAYLSIPTQYSLFPSIQALG